MTEEQKTKIKESAEKTIRPEEIKPGMVIKIHQKIKELNAKGEEKERIQIFEGTVLAVHRGANGTFTVRKISDGVGVEKILPFHLPSIAKIEMVRAHKVRRAKVYHLRNYGKKLKEI
jgi:large subunit ribosomal protein L19